MSYDVHLSVIFPCDDNEPTATLAKKHLALIGEREDNGGREVVEFLSDLSQRSGRNKGQKGGLSMWGLVGNYTRVDVFVELLKPFWFDLLSLDESPLLHEHVLIFYEIEQSEHASAYEIGMTGPTGEPKSELFVRHHEHLPFAWMQF